jgi:hypothetical protein
MVLTSSPLTQGYGDSNKILTQGYTFSPIISVSALGLLGTLLTQMEKVNIGDSYWDRGLWDDGMWEHDTPMINQLRKMERVNVGDSYWVRGGWEDGMWEFDTTMIKLRKQMENN